MDRVRKTFFDPLATSKERIRQILEGLPVGSAHPFSPESILLCRTESGIIEIDTSSYSEDFFFNAVDLGEMGETLLRRMANFQSHLSVFKDFQILQAPAATFKIPIVSNQITILAVSERTPTYYDFCFADISYNTCCWTARKTFPGITHSGDITTGNDLLDYVKINKDNLTDQEICVFISGFNHTQITRFMGTNPALLVANHVDKILYIIPVPLDAATIGDATICCPMVIKRDGGSLICSILPTATTDREMMCSTDSLISEAFPEAIKRADFTISALEQATVQVELDPDALVADASYSPDDLRDIIAKERAVFTTRSTTYPSFLDLEKTQIINFDTGLEFRRPGEDAKAQDELSSVVLPCIFGSLLQGPILLATGKIPSNIPFRNEEELREYYSKLKSVVFIVDERMTDNARNIATTYRINALFIVQLSSQEEPKNADEVLSLMNVANINAVTALAGPQSLVLVQISDKYYFYRGIANQAHLNTAALAFGSDVTSTIMFAGAESILEPRIERIVDLRAENTILLPILGQSVRPQDLEKLFDDLGVEQARDLEEDIAAAIPQLQMLLNQKDLQELSKALLSVLSTKVNKVVGPLREAYIHFLTREHKREDPESVKKKNKMLGELRKTTKEMQTVLEPVISSLASMMSAQTTSKRTHDLKRLVRQAQIQGNVEATKSMTFETLAGFLETHASEMGVMLLNIETAPYRQLLFKLKNTAIDASECCDLDSRVLHLDGFDAGIIIEQSQSSHQGPLANQAGPLQPILALPFLSERRGTGSMLAWVCWDEFVNLKSPYTVRWMEKCNEAHIAALRIIMRDTLSQAVASRQHDIQAGSPETGHLMSSLLMAAMSKLAAMKTSAPVVTEEAEDTVTRLMRGLFGNLLTIAGSGVRPLSMVWQLFGLNPQYDIPTSDVDWVWYETVVALYPYTGWPLKQFYNNLERFLDKVIVRVVTRNESVASVKEGRADEMIKYCKLRNIQLDHSRTIITIFERMLTTENIDTAVIANRLLEQLPRKLEKQTSGYGRMMRYLNHLAKGGEQRTEDNRIAANVYNRRSATFAALKTRVSEACVKKDWAEVKKACQALMDKQDEIAALWHLLPNSFKFQNIKVYSALLAADFGDGIDQETKNMNLDLVRQVTGDAEKGRVPWQVGKRGEFGDDIEPLDEGFLHEIMTGETVDSWTLIEDQNEKATDDLALPTTVAVAKKTTEDELAEFKGTISPSFLTTMQKNLSAEDVCGILNVPVSAMRAFIKALNPEFVWEGLGANFKVVILDLLKNRSNRLESYPVKKLLELEKKSRARLQIEDGVRGLTVGGGN